MTDMVVLPRTGSGVHFGGTFLGSKLTREGRENRELEIEDLSLENEDDASCATNGPHPGEVVLLVRQAM